MAVRNRLSAWAARWLVASLAVTASACSWSSTTDRGGPMSAFHPCAETSMWASAPLPEQRRGALQVGCATLTVPVDHADPGRGSLDTAVVRVRATSQHDRIGSLVLNPGGPGLSGLDFMPLWASWLPDELLARFDLVTFDPRGTGRSTPIRCGVLPADQTTAATQSLLTDAGFATAMQLLQARAQSCVDALGDRTTTFSTDATARDLDLLRVALGEDTLTFVGWSYGARLGAHYAHLFPDRVRALVLDGPPDPQAARNSVVESQIAGFEAAFAAYADQCAQRETCTPSGDVRALFDRVVRTARSAPIRSGRPAGDPPANADTVLRAVLGFLASPETWPLLDAALREANGGDSGSLYDMIDSLEGKTPEHRDVDVDDAAFVIGCNDSASGAPAAQLRVEAARLSSTYPRFGEYGSWWLFGCTYWTMPHPVLPVPDTAMASPVLVIATEADPATPYSGGVALARVLGPNAKLLTVSGGGHTAFGRSPCVAEHVTVYLVELRVPGGQAC